jgi:hypothetical protein
VSIGQFNKTIFGVIYVIGVLSKVLAKVTLLGAQITLKKFYEIGHKAEIYELSVGSFMI